MQLGSPVDPANGFLLHCRQPSFLISDWAGSEFCARTDERRSERRS